jgi:excisionase family DNA binding protein
MDYSRHPPIAYTLASACAALGVGRTRLYELISQGKIEARACGGRTLIPAQSLLDFVASLPAAPVGERHRKDDTRSNSSLRSSEDVLG